MNRKICILVTSLLLLAALVPFASATTVIFDSYQPTLNSTHGNAMGGSANRVAATFTADVSGTVTTVKIPIRCDAGFEPNGYLSVSIWNTVTEIPSTLLSTSTTFLDVSTTAGVSYTQCSFTFNQAVTAAGIYAIVIADNSTNLDSSHYVMWGGTSSPTDPSKYYNSVNSGSSWTYGSTLDLMFEVSGTMTSTPVGGDTGFWDTGIGAQIFAFIPTLTSLIVVLLAAFLGWKFAGPWGFFAGINLGYIVSVALNILPLWGMIALLVVDGLLLFGKVGFHN